MEKWFCNKEIINETINSAMNELEYLTINPTENYTANYLLDNTHNIFVFIEGNGYNDIWIEIHYELYDCKGEIIGDLYAVNTDDISKECLFKEIETIVHMYYGM